MVFMRPQYLDSKVKWVWLLPTLVVIVLIWIIVSAVAFAGISQDDHILGLSIPIFLLVFLVSLLILIAGPVMAFHHLEFISFTYVCNESEFVIRQGVITRHTTVIPYHRIQNINTTRTLIERIFGLATLEIETAGANPDGILPGISNKDQLIKEIMTSVENAKRAKKNGSDGLPSERELLAEILKELSRTNHNLSQMLRNGHNLKVKSPTENKIHWPSMSPSNSKHIGGNKK
jgi:uncharacterized membrane protein YdbT with pleckstrin-like domain